MRRTYHGLKRGNSPLGGRIGGRRRRHAQQPFNAKTGGEVSDNNVDGLGMSLGIGITGSIDSSGDKAFRSSGTGEGLSAGALLLHSQSSPTLKITNNKVLGTSTTTVDGNLDAACSATGTVDSLRSLPGRKAGCAIVLPPNMDSTSTSSTNNEKGGAW